MKLVLHQVPARHGAQWLRQGWQVFRRAPLAFMALLAGFLLMALLASLVPFIGPVLSLGAVPLLSLVYLLHSHHALQGKPLGWSLWAAPFRLSPQRTHAQLRLGLLFVILTVAVMALAHLVDGGALLRLQEALAELGPDSQTQQEALVLQAAQDPKLWLGALLRLAGALAVSIPFWHAPALIHWGGQGALQALFSSTLGLWRNRAAFLLNGALWLGVMAAGTLALGLLGVLLGALLQWLVMPLLLLMGSVFYAGLYFMFVDSFRFVADTPSQPDDPAPPRHPSGEA